VPAARQTSPQQGSDGEFELERTFSAELMAQHPALSWDAIVAADAQLFAHRVRFTAKADIRKLVDKCAHFPAMLQACGGARLTRQAIGPQRRYTYRRRCLQRGISTARRCPTCIGTRAAWCAVSLRGFP